MERKLQKNGEIAREFVGALTLGSMKPAFVPTRSVLQIANPLRIRRSNRPKSPPPHCGRAHRSLRRPYAFRRRRGIGSRWESDNLTSPTPDAVRETGWGPYRDAE